MRPSPWMMRLYVLDAALLLAHEIDSAFWHEWALFGFGDEAFFVLVHIPLVIVVLWGVLELDAGRPWGDRIAALLALTGFAALFIHGSFLARGAAEFRAPVSLVLIGVMAAVSVALGAFAVPRLVTSCPLRLRFGRGRS